MYTPLSMRTPEHCRHRHVEIIFDSRYGEYKCPLCEKIKALFTEEQINTSLMEQIEQQPRKENQ